MNQTISTVYYVLFAALSSFLIHRISRHQTLQGNHVKGKKGVIGYADLYSLLLILLVILFCAFRKIDENIGGTDAYAYMIQFKQSTGTITDQIIRFRGWEPLHAISLWIVRKFTDEYRAYLVIYYIIMSLFLIKYSKMIKLNKNWFLATFGLMLLFLNSFNTQRNTFAMFASIYILDALLKRRYKRGIIIILLISGFHFSALIWFVVIGASMFIRFLKGDVKTKLFTYIVLSSVLSFAALRFFPYIVRGKRLGVYVNVGSSLSVPMLLIFLFVVLVFVVYYRDMMDYTQHDDMVTISTLYVAFAPMFIFQLHYSIMYRMMLYSIPVLYILLTKYKIFFKNRGNNNVSIVYFICNMIYVFRFLPFMIGGTDIGLYANILL